MRFRDRPWPEDPPPDVSKIESLMAQTRPGSFHRKRELEGCAPPALQHFCDIQEQVSLERIKIYGVAWTQASTRDTLLYHHEVGAEGGSEGHDTEFGDLEIETVCLSHLATWGLKVFPCRTRKQIPPERQTSIPARSMTWAATGLKRRYVQDVSSQSSAC